VSDANLRIAASLAAGLLFGLGLVISGMSNPAKILNFLDIFGSWDPSLAFVMAGAVTVTFLGYRFVLACKQPLFDAAFHVPTAKDIDPPLVAGAATFGLGWGLSGFCPGPAFTALPLLAQGTLAFVPAMLIGMWAARRAPKLRWPLGRQTL
jgi:uncharacterized membrane protein YedE/YeeE